MSSVILMVTVLMSVVVVVMTIMMLIMMIRKWKKKQKEGLMKLYRKVSYVEDLQGDNDGDGDKGANNDDG